MSKDHLDDEKLVEAMAKAAQQWIAVGDHNWVNRWMTEALAVARKALAPSQSDNFRAGYVRGVQDAADIAVPYGRGDYVGFIAEKILKLLDALPLTPSPTAYVRPAAEIRAEINRAVDAGEFMVSAYCAGLLFTIARPTTEKPHDPPRAATVD